MRRKRRPFFGTILFCVSSEERRTMGIKLGKLTTCNLTERPFVGVSESKVASDYPFPLALIGAMTGSDRELSGLAMRLFHALVYLSWNCFKGATVSPSLACGTAVLRRLVSDGRITRADLERAMQMLLDIPVRLPGRATPHATVQTTLLSQAKVDPDSDLTWWRFSDTVFDWIRSVGATYVWMDLTVTRQMTRPASLRLYELCSAFAGRRRSTISATPDDLRSSLGVGDSYRDLTDFHTKLVGRAIKEVGTSAPLEVTCSLKSVANSKHRKFVLHVTQKADWAPKSEFEASPLRLADLLFLPDPPPGFTAHRAEAEQPHLSSERDEAFYDFA
jgi:hypothetical protein